jgi:hypothetical protein
MVPEAGRRRSEAVTTATSLGVKSNTVTQSDSALACVHCGNTESTSDHPAYVGGRGYICQRFCDDAVACWQRWDEAHGLT